MQAKFKGADLDRRSNPNLNSEQMVYGYFKT